MMVSIPVNSNPGIHSVTSQRILFDVLSGGSLSLFSKIPIEDMNN